MKKTRARWVSTVPVTLALLLSGIAGFSGNRSPEDATNAAPIDPEPALSTDVTSSEPVVKAPYEEEPCNRY
ncbi:MAG: hypothetical protein EBE86_029500 [Hormoscilla sp. GUM202]|nr:hypothetical protein [Hormoscilla sp. GUM202]